MSAATEPITLVGPRPPFPWPLAQWSWFTRPIRAEYLAIVRIGFGIALLADLLLQYRPDLPYLYGPGTIGSPAQFIHDPALPKWKWSLFIGVHQSAFTAATLIIWLALTLVLAGRLAKRRSERVDLAGDAALDRRLLCGWTISGLLYLLGVWIRGSVAFDAPQLMWLTPLLMAAVAAGLRFAGRSQPHWKRAATASLLVSLAALGVGIALAVPSASALRDAVVNTFVNWGDRDAVISASFVVFVGAAGCLCLGLFSRSSAFLCWVLLLSFTNLNPLINSRGDAIRDIIPFYLMLGPCGAAWSLDSLIARRRGAVHGRVFVSPWPVRMLLIQLCTIYFFTGLFKLFSDDWWSGRCLYYVLCDLVLARNSFNDLRIPYPLLQLGTWFALLWEVTFPLWLLTRWSRIAVFLIGVSFHLGTFAVLELGGFEWYMTVLYLPLIPWSRWLRGPVVWPESSSTAIPEIAVAATGSERGLGWFVAGQLVFLAVTNTGGILAEVSDHLTDDQRPVADIAAPDWAAQTGPFWQAQEAVVAPFRAWGEFINQTQYWSMYRTAPPDSFLPAVEIVYLDESGESKSLKRNSEYEPDDVQHFTRFGEGRYSRFEIHVVVQLPLIEGQPQSVLDKGWAAMIANSVLYQRTNILNYLRGRVRQMQAANPDLPPPREVILSERIYRINAPGTSPDIWSGPTEVPIARWRPTADHQEQILEAWDPSTGEYHVPTPERIEQLAAEFEQAAAGDGPQ